jgi:hypothetical protein
MGDEKKAKELGYETEEKGPEFYAVQIQDKDEKINLPWVRVTRSRYVTHEGPSAAGSLDEIKMAISEAEGISPECVNASHGYDNNISASINGFNFRFPGSKLGEALEFTKLRKQEVNVFIPRAEGSHYNESLTVKKVKTLTKKKVDSLDYLEMSIGGEWHLDQGTLKHCPEDINHLRLQRASRMANRRSSVGPTIRRCRIDEDILHAMLRICIVEIERSEIFRATQGYYYCAPPLREDTPSSREGHTMAIWKLAKLIVMVFKKPIYRSGKYDNRIPSRTWWDCVKELSEKNMKDTCMRDDFEKFIKSEIRAMKKLPKQRKPKKVEAAAT